MPESPAGVPVWLWKTVAWVVGGAFAILTTILGYLGKRYVTKRDEQIQELKEQMGDEHSDVEEKVERLEYKVDTLLEEVQT